MKVLIIPSWYATAEYPQNGVFFREQAVLLAGECDVKVAVYTPFSFRKLWAYWKHGAFRSILADDAPEHWYMGGWNPLPLLPDSPGRMLSGAAERIVRQCTRSGWVPDIIHAHSIAPAGMLAHNLSALLDRPYFITEHRTSLQAVFSGTTAANRAERAYLDAHTVFCVSQGLADTVRSFGIERKLEVLPNFIDTDYFTPVERKDARSTVRLLFAGSLWKKKGVDVLLEALGGLDTGLEWSLTIAGDGPERSALEKQAGIAGIADRCRFLGNLGRERIRDEMRACDLFVLPSRKETFGIVVIEAMACGKPVVVTASGGPEYVVDDECGIIVPVDDSAALAQAIYRAGTGLSDYSPDIIRRHVTEKYAAPVILAELIGRYRNAGV